MSSFAGRTHFCCKPDHRRLLSSVIPPSTVAPSFLYVVSVCSSSSVSLCLSADHSRSDHRCLVTTLASRSSLQSKLCCRPELHRSKAGNVSSSRRRPCTPPSLITRSPAFFSPLHCRHPRCRGSLRAEMTTTKKDHCRRHGCFAVSPLFSLLSLRRAVVLTVAVVTGKVHSRSLPSGRCLAFTTEPPPESLREPPWMNTVRQVCNKLPRWTAIRSPVATTSLQATPSPNLQDKVSSAEFKQLPSGGSSLHLCSHRSPQAAIVAGVAHRPLSSSSLCFFPVRRCLRCKPAFLTRPSALQNAITSMDSPVVATRRRRL